jgi:hypothetical protein
MPQNNKCVKVKRRIGWSVGNKHTTDLCWPANTDALKESWAKITCSAGKDAMENKCCAALYTENVHLGGEDIDAIASNQLDV